MDTLCYWLGRIGGAVCDQIAYIMVVVIVGLIVALALK